MDALLPQLCGRGDCCPPNGVAELDMGNRNDLRHEQVRGTKCLRTFLFGVETSERHFDTSLVNPEHAEEAQMDKLRRKIYQCLLKT